LLSVFSPALWRLLSFVLLIVLIPAHIVWFAERNRPDGIIENKNYFPGIWKAIWWSAGTLGAQADEMPRSPLGRLVALVWMFSGIIFVSYFTAVVTASLTVQQLQGDIHGPEDLPGKRVATTLGSTSSSYLRDMNLRPIEYSQITEAYGALTKGEVDAVVFDSPVLLYYATRQGRGEVQVVGTVFRKEDYGIVFPRNSALRKPVNEAVAAFARKRHLSATLR
jgi:polar amino acid transport system substrate-binding protein